MENDTLIHEFLLESFENLSTIDEDLTKLERDPENVELINKIYRTVHTMKGSASFLNFEKLLELTHTAENVLDKIRENQIKFDSQIADVILRSFDTCKIMLKNIEENKVEGDVDISDVKNLLSDIFENNHPSAKDCDQDEVVATNEVKENNVDESQVASREDLEESNDDDDSLDSLINVHVSDSKCIDSPVKEEAETNEAKSSPSNESDDGNEPVSDAALESLKEAIESGAMGIEVLDDLDEESKNKVLAHLNKKVEEVKEPEAKVEEAVKKEEKKVPAKAQTPEGNSVQSTSTIADSVVRVNVSVLDKIMNIVGELVLNRNELVQHASNAGIAEYSRLSQQLNIITSELQSEVMSTRMQPIGSVLSKFERLVRDLSRSSNKKIQLRLEGQGTELDKTLIEAIKDPLVHIVRNAADHGLENVEDRVKAGKGEEGSLTIKAYNESGQVTIEVSDDGRGLSKEKIIAKAIEKKVISDKQAQSFSDEQVFSLIFAPGFSTAEKVTNISGRGVGMDVVKTNIEKIGGSVAVSSIPNVGTTFKLKIPLTLAIVPALIVKSSEESFAIPQLNLVELVRLSKDNPDLKIEKIQDVEFLRLRGKLTPVFRLNKELDLGQIKKSVGEINGKVSEEIEESKQEDDSLNVVILNADDKVYGIIVDEILDTQEIVVKPLNSTIKDLNVFGGATINGDGSVALIVDAAGFLRKVSHTTESHESMKSIDLSKVDDSKEVSYLESYENLLLRLADDQVYAIPLSLVSRLEEFDGKKVDYTGNQPIIKYLDHPMPLLNVEHSLKYEEKSVLDSNDLKKERVPCIVSKVRGKNYGLVVKEIMDISVDQFEIDSSAVDRDGILGTIFVKDEAVSVLDLYSIVELQNIGTEEFSKQPDSMRDQFQNFKLLLVDDSSMYRKMEGDYLKSEGFEVLIANDGNHAKEILDREEGIHLVVTDIEMPNCDGYQLAKNIRACEKSSALPIIALSTRCSDEDKKKGVESGFTLHLEKFKKEEVISAVKNVLKIA